MKNLNIPPLQLKQLEVPYLVEDKTFVSKFLEAFNDKVTVVGTHSGGGGHQVLSHMQDQLSYVGCNVIGRKILTSYAKELNLESLDDVLNRLYKLS